MYQGFCILWYPSACSVQPTYCLLCGEDSPTGQMRKRPLRWHDSGRSKVINGKFTTSCSVSSGGGAILTGVQMLSRTSPALQTRPSNISSQESDLCIKSLLSLRDCDLWIGVTGKSLIALMSAGELLLLECLEETMPCIVYLLDPACWRCPSCLAT